MATHIISAEISTTGVTLDLSSSFSTIGEILNNIGTDTDNTSNLNFNSAFVTAAQPTGASDGKLRFTSMGITGGSTGWRIRNGLGTEQTATFSKYRGEDFDYDFLDGYDTFILSEQTGTHQLDGKPKAAGAQDFLTATPRVFNSDGYDIIGSHDDDVITASSSIGRDTLTGKLGSDALTGNVGEDYFSYSLGDITDAGIRNDSINNFESGTDKIELTGGLSLGTGEGEVVFDDVFGALTILAVIDGGTPKIFAQVSGVILAAGDFVETI